ncbi:MAG: DUF4867 family protein [Treponema sp.]|nr:DUF4867 family protein [Treponema sp.]
MLEKLQKANPHIQIHSVRDKEFARYGMVLEGFDVSGLVEAALKGVEVPKKGCGYLAALEVLDKHPDAKKLRSQLAGQTDAQIGICWGYNQFLDALEYHNSSEIVVAATPAVLLVADRRDIKKGRLNTNKVKAFMLEKGDTVEVYATTLHYAPCEVKGSFNCIIVLPRGTNLPLAKGEKPAPWLFSKNKWLLAHPDKKELLDQGAYAGLYGTNWQIHPIK